MQFVNPLFLIALTTLAIPILIHFFNFRKFKKVYFTNVSFLREIEQQTRKQSQLKQILILISRLVALSALVLAFAQPYIPHTQTRKNTGRQKTIAVYIDNSFSMEGASTDGQLLDAAKARALDIAAAYSPSDLFMLLTNDFEGKHQRLAGLEEFRKLVAEVRISPASRTLPEIINRMNDITHGQTDGYFDNYLVSDFQKTNSSILQTRPDTTMSWYLVPLSPLKQNNLFIDSIWFRAPVHQPGQPVTLSISIRNNADESLEKIPLKLMINGSQKALSSFTVSAGSSTEVVMPYTEGDTGIQYGTLMLSDYPVVYDDRFFFAYQIEPNINVACISDNGSNPYIDMLFQGDSAISFTNVNSKQIDFSGLRKSSTIILNSLQEISTGLTQELKRFVGSGGTLIVFPPARSGPATSNAMLAAMNVPGFDKVDTSRQRVASLNFESHIYEDIFEGKEKLRTDPPGNLDLPVVTKHYTSLPGTGNQEVLLTLENKDPFLSACKTGRGTVYKFAVPADETWSSLPRHVIFVPTLFKIALLSTPVYKLWYLAGRNETVEVPTIPANDPEIIKLVNRSSGLEVIPEIRKLGTRMFILTHDQIREPGLYTAMQENRPLGGIAFNIDSRESYLSCYTAAELNDQISRMPHKNLQIIRHQKNTLTNEIKTIKQGTPLWKWFIGICLLFLMAEILLLRFFKPGRRSPDSVPGQAT